MEEEVPSPEELEELLPAALSKPDLEGAGGGYPLARAAIRRAIRARAPVIRFPVRVLRYAAAAALLLAMGLAWGLRRTGPLPGPTPAAEPARTDSALLLGRSGRPAVWHSGRGVTVTVAAGGRALVAPGGSIRLEAGEIWAECAPGASCEVATAAGKAELDGATAWVAVAAVALPEALGRPQGLTGAILRDARAGDADRVWVGVASGSARWQGLSLGPDEVACVERGEVRKTAWEPASRGRAEGWLKGAREAGWVDLLANEGQYLRSPRPLRGTSEGLLLEGEPGTSWIASEPPSPGRPYVLEVVVRLTGAGAGASLAYPADGRFPLADVAPGAWRRLRVVVCGAGTEIRAGDRLLKFAPGTFSKTALREHPLQGAGFLLWNGGALEIRSWKVKSLDADGVEIAP